jgi:hypothetical protein
MQAPVDAEPQEQPDAIAYRRHSSTTNGRWWWTLLGDAGLPGKEQPALPEKTSQPVLDHPAESVIEVQFRTIVEAFCAEAMKRKAQWIIIEPDIAGGYQVGLEIGGRYHRWQQLMPREAVGVLSLIRTMAGMPQHPKEGRPGTFTGRSSGVTAYFRVLEVCALAGQRMTIRVFNSALTPPKLDQLGYTASQLAQIKKALNKDSGLILFCGPARSGKKTALIPPSIGAQPVASYRHSPGTIEFAMLESTRPRRPTASVAQMLHTLEQTDAEVIMIDCLLMQIRHKWLSGWHRMADLVLAGLMPHPSKPP